MCKTVRSPIEFLPIFFSLLVDGRYLNSLRKVLLMRSDRLYRLLESYPIVVPAIVAVLIVIFGGIGVYLAEHNIRR